MSSVPADSERGARMSQGGIDRQGAGGVTFAGIMMVLIGMFEAVGGLAAIIKDEFFVSTPNYFITLDVTTWGWIHLILGIVVILAGFALFRAATWARVVGIVMAGISAIANFLYIPYYPFWSIVIIALCAWVIWALGAHGRVFDDRNLQTHQTGPIATTVRRRNAP
jgi:hypothetical protein